jgi:thiol-disulfide isomerase/thioredoxin
VRRDLLTGVILGAMFLCVSFLGAASPIARFSVTRSDGGSPTEVILDARQSQDPDGELLSYQWIFGDGSTGSGAVVVHSYPSISTYTVTLLVRNGAGTASLVTQRIDLSTSGPQSLTPPVPPRVTDVASVEDPTGYRVGQRAPEFSLPNALGEPVRLADHRGQVVLLEFWSRSCGACQAAMPYVESLRVRYAKRGLVVLLISVHRQADGDHAYLRARGFESLISLREQDPIERPTMAAYNVSRIPHAFLIDAQGIIRYNGHINLLSPTTIEALLASLPVG